MTTTPTTPALSADTPESVAARLRHYDQLDMPLYHEAAAVIDAMQADREAQAAEIARLTEESAIATADLLIAATSDNVLSARARAAEARATRAEADRDALLGAIGFKPGPLGDDLRRKVVLDDAAGMRPAMVKARRQAGEAEGDAMLADCFVRNRGGLLLRVWGMLTGERQKRRKAEAALAASEAEVQRLTVQNEDLSAAALTAYNNGVEHAFEAAKEAAEDRVRAMREALEDMLAGWKYIRKEHGDLYGVAWDRAQAAADSVLTTPPLSDLIGPADTTTTTCQTCQGNGEVVTDWERYLHGEDGDVGDEAVADCPDCDGIGTVAADTREGGQ